MSITNSKRLFTKKRDAIWQMIKNRISINKSSCVLWNIHLQYIGANKDDCLTVVASVPRKDNLRPNKQTTITVVVDGATKYEQDAVIKAITHSALAIAEGALGLYVQAPNQKLATLLKKKEA